MNSTVYYCTNGHEPVAQVGKHEEDKECPQCKGLMGDIGWFESDDLASRAVEVLQN